MYMPRFMRFLTVLALFVALLSMQPGLTEVQADGDRFAAIAYSSSTGKYGYSYGYGSRAEAETQAVIRAKAEDAQVVVWVKNGWAALALGDKKGAYGYGWSAESRADAENRALKQASKRTSGAYIACWTFSGK